MLFYEDFWSYFCHFFERYRKNNKTFIGKENPLDFQEGKISNGAIG